MRSPLLTFAPSNKIILSIIPVICGFISISSRGTTFPVATVFLIIVALKAFSVSKVLIFSLFLLPSHTRTPANVMKTITNIIFALLLILIMY